MGRIKTLDLFLVRLLLFSSSFLPSPTSLLPKLNSKWGTAQNNTWVVDHRVNTVHLQYERGRKIEGFSPAHIWKICESRPQSTCGSPRETWLICGVERQKSILKEKNYVHNIGAVE